ncbi:MAG: hypothetical protein RM368_15550 [Nostoc sp. DedSLP03]|uniref:hypothetical protein n=1 Tax=Nostoc sp. DedSLP03 TaxID=3075400 RepID=UPI002AD2DC1D|nr:hypothetical protein [Nostoc sp. DedSLP03]MDZ7966368.1 hypothetical protein [Nostoc sp. DedSLP03]
MSEVRADYDGAWLERFEAEQQMTYMTSIELPRKLALIKFQIEQFPKPITPQGD